jgi:hypothetical protein
VGGARFVDEIGFAFGWIAPQPRFMQRASHAVAAAGRVWVIDPVADERALARVRELGHPAESMPGRRTNEPCQRSRAHR